MVITVTILRYFLIMVLLRNLRRLVPTALAVPVAVFLTGCSSLVPHDEILSSLGSDSFMKVAGQNVYVEVAGEGETILLLHGFGGSTFSWRDSLPHLSRTHRVVALDLFGFGYTERPRRLRHYSRRGQVDLILGVLDRLGVARAHVIGHSYGGGLAMTLAAKHPERVRSIVLVNSTAPNWAISRRRNLAEISPLTWLFVRGYALRPATVRTALERSWHDDSLVTDEIVDGYLKRLRIQGAARAYRGLTVPMSHEAEEDLVVVQDLTQPTLVIWGVEDELIPVEDGELASSQMRNSRFVPLEGTGHSPMEEDPQAFLALVEDFLRAVEAGHAVALAAEDR